MLSVSLHASRTALISCLLLWGHSAVAQVSGARLDGPVHPADISAHESAAPLRSSRPAGPRAWETNQSILRAQAAHALAVDYLDLWSAPNQLTLATVSSFYGPTVKFHGRERTLDSVLAEKRRFAERWPQRTYSYRPETTTVACESDGASCTVWAIFDFSAAAPAHGRRSLGIGEHELVVSLSSGRPVIVSETSRVLHHGLVRSD
jgi:hypothetical protein